MKKLYFLIMAVAIIFTHVAKAQNYVVARWQVNSTTQTITGDANGNIDATTADPNLQLAQLSRAAGLTALATNYGYSSSVTGATANTEANSISVGDAYIVKLKALNGTLSISKVSYRLLRSGNGPKRFRWSYSLDGVAFTNIGTEIVLSETVTTADVVREIDVSAITGLTNVSNTTTVTFRVVAYDNHGASTKNFGLRSNVGAAVAFEGSLSTTLPVNLSAFSGKPQSNGVLLNWQTATEQNNSHFEVLRSSDAKNFVVIGQQAGSKNSTAIKNYTFLDSAPLTGTSYYALKQFDLNGDFKLYDPIAVNNGFSISGFSVFQNQQNLTAIINIGKDSNGEISIYDLIGNKVAQTSRLLNKGYNSLDLSTTKLVSGRMYIVNLIADSQVKSIKIIKQ